MIQIRYADVNDAKVMGEIHSASWKVTYKGIVPDSFLDRISAESRANYFLKALTERFEEDVLIYVDDKAVGLMTIGKCRDYHLTGTGQAILDFLLISFLRKAYEGITFCLTGFPVGRTTVKVVLFSPLRAVIEPPCALTISLAMASPNPAPPVWDERAESSRKNLSKMVSSFCDGMGSPLFVN